MLKVTRWSPDTCSCILEYSWDDTTSEDTRTHTPTAIVQRCTAHQNLPDTNTHFNGVADENRLKNFSLDEILQNAPSTAWYDIDPQSGQRVFKNGVIIDYSFSGTTPNRILTLNISGVTLTNQQKNTLQQRLNNRFGTGKVVIA